MTLMGDRLKGMVAELAAQDQQRLTRFSRPFLTRRPRP